MSSRVRLYSRLLIFSFSKVPFFSLSSWNDKTSNYSLVQSILFLVRPSFGAGSTEMIMASHPLWELLGKGMSWMFSLSYSWVLGRSICVFLLRKGKYLCSFLLYFHLEFIKLNLQKLLYSFFLKIFFVFWFIYKLGDKQHICKRILHNFHNLYLFFLSFV